METILENTLPIGKPKWLKVKLPIGQKYTELRGLVDKYKLNTICTSGSCPNMGECWGEGTATFMILGNICTRSCGFCGVKTGRPETVDWDEPEKVARSIKIMNIKHAVVTSVDRDVFESHLQSVFTQRGAGWVEKTLGDICVVDWGNTDLTKSSYVEGGKFLAVSAAGCDGRIGHKEHAKHTPVLSAIGAQCGRMFLPEEDFTAIKNTITLTPRDGTCAGKFLFRLLTHVELPKRGAAQPFITKGDILKFQIVVPEDSSTQLRIVDSLGDLEEETQRLARLYERKLVLLEALKKSLLHEAFTGQL